MSEDTRQSHYDFYRAAKSHEAQGRYKEALDAYANAISLDKNFADAWFYKGRLHHKLSQYDEAICCAEKALDLKPSWEKHVRSILDDAKAKSG